MPATPEPNYDASEKVVALGRELATSCPEAALILLTLGACMKVAHFEGQPIRTLALASMAVGDLLQAEIEANKARLSQMARDN